MGQLDRDRANEVGLRRGFRYGIAMTDALCSHLFASDLAELSGDRAALQRVASELDRTPVLHIRLQHAPSPASIAALASQLGSLRPYPAHSMRTAPGFDAIGDFSAAAQPDDGRPRVPAFIESLHYDVLHDGLAGYGVLHPRDVPEGAVMRFVDMRALHAELSEAMKVEFAALRVVHHPRATAAQPRPPGFELPLSARHPRTQAGILVLPNLRDSAVRGLPEVEGRALVAELWARVERSAHQVQAVLCSGDVWVWDNLATVHDNPAFRRDRAREVWFLNVPAREAPAAYVAAG